ncbi:MAG: hypothetical protein Ct9H300mP16_10670 [Pseudomonadota bacterium]|nr:MAG: hypothetical protein Ct9H300mP16_10670 [Pseudomonadota bacterium]
MIRPGSSLFNPLMILPLMAALCYAVFQIMSRNLGSTERAASKAFSSADIHYSQCLFRAVGRRRTFC